MKDFLVFLFFVFLIFVGLFNIWAQIKVVDYKGYKNGYREGVCKVVTTLIKNAKSCDVVFTGSTVEDLAAKAIIIE